MRIIVSVFATLLATAFASAAEACPSGWKIAHPASSEFSLCWQLKGDMLDVEMSHPGIVWIALGFGGAMAGTDAVIGRPDTGEILDVFIKGYDKNAIVPDERQNLNDTSVYVENARTIVKFSRALNTQDDEDSILSTGVTSPFIWAVGSSPGFSGHFTRGVMSVDWGAGALFSWNLNILLHAILMFFAWGVLMPLGVLIARYYKVTVKQNFPNELDNQFWWIWHRALLYFATLLAATGVILIWRTSINIDGNWHAIVGIAALVMGVGQIISGVLRGSKGGPVSDNGIPNPPHKVRGDHYDMTLYRRVFEVAHKNGGYISLALGFAAILLGVQHAGMHWIVSVVFILWCCIITGKFVYLQKNGRWVATYHAIWGMDVRHPGNRMRAKSTEENQQ